MTQALPFLTPNAAPAKQSPGEKQGQLLMILWALLVGLFLLIKAGKLLVFIFPVGSLAVGLFLYFRAPVLYVNFTWWMLFLGSLVRKIIDYQSGYVTPGRWGFPALLVASISLITLLKHLPRANREGGLPFILSLLGLTYAFMIGVAYDRLNIRYLIGVIEWFAPFAFGFHLFAQWRHYPAYRKGMLSTFTWGTLVMGAYSIYQYCIAPEWEKFYLTQLGVTSFGRAVPFELRVWGTSTSPQDFGAIMLAGIILIFSGQGVVRFASAGTGYLGFLLTMARSAWLGWCAAAIMFVPSLTLKLQVRLLITILVMSMVVLPITQMEPFAEAIGGRLESLTNTEDDQSLDDRTSGYQLLYQRAVVEFVGLGLGGSPGISTSLGGSDTSIFPLMFQFGWFGAIPYVGGILLILMKLFRIQQLRADAFGSASRAVALGIFSQIGFNQIFINVFGFVLWGFLGISMAAGNYYQFSKGRNKSAPN